MWSKLRTGEFDFNTEHANFFVSQDMIQIMRSLIHTDPEQRPSCRDLLVGVPQLLRRIKLLEQGLYSRTVNPEQLFNQNTYEKNEPTRLNMDCDIDIA